MASRTGLLPTRRRLGVGFGDERASIAASAGGAVGIPGGGRGRPLAGVSCAALAIACWLPSAASAATYFVSNDTELNTAITTANGDGDPSSTIVMTQSFAATAGLPSPTKPITIDTGGFTLSSVGNSLQVTTTNGALLTLSGTFHAADAAGTGGIGFSETTIVGAPSVITNNGLISGGASTSGGAGGAGLNLSGVTTFTNNGAITGGTGGLSGGTGAQIRSGSSMTNYGSIQGGSNSGAGAGGEGVDLGGPGALATLTNHGTISGGSGSGGALGAGVLVRNGGGQIVNTDTIEGGNGAAAAITTNSATTALNIVNSGTIRAGPGATEAIGWASGVTPTTGSINLELQAGSVIEGNVVGNPTATTDTLRLGGNADSIFDVSTIGAQYQNFDVFEKTGTSTWALTGAGAATTNWTIEQGTLQLGNGGASGSIIGNVTDNGTLAFDRADTMTFSGVISGAGGVSQIGAGTTILTATNAYTGGTAINGGALQVSSDANLGAAAGPLSFDGGTLATTASFSTARATTLNAGGGAFDVAPSTTFSVTGAIGGPGALTKTDAGTLILTANNSYSGGTTIGAGTLQLGNGGTSGGITGDVTDNGALAFNRSDSATFSGAISGGGAVAQIGTGTTILTGDNSYTGRTTISAGTLQLGNGGTSGSIVGNIVDNGALVFNRSDRATLGGVVSGSGTVAQIGPGTTVLTGANTYTGGTTISAGTLQLGNGGATGSILGDVANSGTLAFDRGDTTTFAGVISGAGGVAQIGSGETILNAANPYSGGTIVSAGTLAIGDFAHPSAVLAGGGLITVQSGGTLGGYGSVAGSVINSGVVAAGNATPGFGDPPPTGTFTIIGDLLNRGTVQLASGQSVGNALQVQGNYVGGGGAMAINTFLGGDGSPSDLLVISGGGATGETFVHVNNIGGPGAQTTNGILVVDAINGATTAPGAFTLTAGELRAGAYDYDLLRGGLGGSDPQDWFLRSSLVSSPPTTGPSTVPPQSPVAPPTPPPNPLPPGGVFPIIGPELATYGVVQPLARQLGLSILGTLDDRVGDTYEPDGCAVAPAVAPADLPIKTSGPALTPCPLFSPSVWGRFFGQTIDNRYQAFADPRASGNMGGFQGGIDLLRGPLIPGGHDRAGLYGAYGDMSADVTGLVTNPAATSYVLTHTGSMSLNAWSAGGYWTHVGPGGWYLDAVLQGTWYYGSASTQYARLNTDGTGFIASLEGGAPFAWPQLGPGFVIEPQGQILWQKVSFRHDYDGLGDVALGDTTGPSGRFGLRGKWTIVTGGGQVWQPYLRANLWRDWGAEANTVYSGTDVVPLLSQVTQLELGGGVTGKVNANVSAFANVDYQFVVGVANGQKQNGVRGAFGARYTW